MNLPNDISLPWIIGLLVFLAASLIYCMALILSSLRKFQLLKMGKRLITFLVIMPFFLLTATVLLGLKGYQNLTHEQWALDVEITPRAEDRFSARLIYPNGQSQSVELTGDQFQVDAYIIKWHGIASALGLGAYYQLDRISGRFVELSADNPAVTSIALSEKSPLNLWQAAKSVPAFEWLYDAQYGSATFSSATQNLRYRITVSQTGLLARPFNP